MCKQKLLSEMFKAAIERKCVFIKKDLSITVATNKTEIEYLYCIDLGDYINQFDANLSEYYKKEISLAMYLIDNYNLITI